MTKGERKDRMETIDLSWFMEETESPGTAAYEHLLDVLYIVASDLQWTADADDEVNMESRSQAFALRYN